ncbi:MAG TPA: TatD family hydrolase [Acidobacteriaceae bacterium]|nr:TatD family hydrolase [Acidobacteriaceae bacterium]
MIDSHAHLDSARYDDDRDAMLERAYAAGVHAILSIGIGDGPETMHRALELARAYHEREGFPAVYATAGVHPHEAKLADEAALVKLDSLLNVPEVLACGEIGLDYFYEYSDREVQKTIFGRQMEIAAGHRKPIVIHCRPSDGSSDAWDDTLAMLDRDWKGTGLGGILHCFTGGWEHARRAMDMGFLISFAGNVTFPKAQPIRDVMVQIPLEKMLIETDAPFLAPTPNRGKRNEPAWVARVAEQAGEVKGIEAKEAALRTAENFERFFGVKGRK